MTKDMIKQKVKAFFQRKLAVHVTLKNSFLNGIIMNLDNKDYFSLDDFKVGETPVFFRQIIDIKKFKPKEEEK